MPLTVYIPAPRTLEGFPGTWRTDPKGKRKRWLDSDGRIYEWDYRHGTVEVYDPRGRHLGEFHPKTVKRLKEPNPTYRIEP